MRSNVHHFPAGPPRTAPLRRVVSRTPRRLALGALVCTVVPVVVLSVPVVSRSGTGGEPLAEAPSAATSGSPITGESPVVMGRDGRPQSSSSVAGRQTSADPAPGGDEDDVPAGTASAGAGAATASGAGTPAVAPAGQTPTSPTEPAAPGTAGGTPEAPTTAPLPAEPAAVPREEQLLELLNNARLGVGCAPLVVDPALAVAAQGHSALMRDTGSLIPADDSSLDVGGRAVTLAHGSDDPAAVLDGWLADPADSAALLDCGRSSTGIGSAQGTDGSWWVQVLA